MPSNLLGPLITSKTRLKLLLRFFLNQNLSGYLQGLSKELEENTNSVRVELNRLKEAGLLSVEEQGRRKVYSVNTSHPLAIDLSNMLRKVTGIEQMLDRVVLRIGDNLQQVWITGALAMGINSDTLNVILVGANLDEQYLSVLMEKAALMIKKTIDWSVVDSEDKVDSEMALLVWQKELKE
jgi:DNA-binding transcriptional ArsR family regulator